MKMPPHAWQMGSGVLVACFVLVFAFPQARAWGAGPLPSPSLPEQQQGEEPTPVPAPAPEKPFPLGGIIIGPETRRTETTFPGGSRTTQENVYNLGMQQLIPSL